MAKLSEEEQAIFPLKDTSSVVKLFKIHLEKHKEPNLAILSLIIGYIENTLTCTRAGVDIPAVESDDTQGAKLDSNTKIENNQRTNLPVVHYKDIECLHHRFLAIIKAHVDITTFGSPKFATPQLVKRVSDVVWCTLSGSYYKDRAHLQSIYSYMTGKLRIYLFLNNFANFKN